MKQFTPTPEQITAAKALFLAMAYLQTVRPDLEKIQQEVLNKFNYKWDIEKTHEPLTDEFIVKYGEYCKKWGMTYLISDKDFAHCLTEYHCRFTEKGYKVKEFGYCPLLVAESMEREAKALLINSMESVTKISYDNLIYSKDWKETIKKYINLTLSLLAPYVKGDKKAA